MNADITPMELKGWLDNRYTALDIAIAVIIVIIVVILFVRIQRRYDEGAYITARNGACHTYLGYSVVGGQLVAGLAVRKRDMERAGVSIQGVEELPALLGVQNPWIFHVLGDPPRDDAGTTTDWTAFAQLHLAKKNPAHRMLLNEAPLGLYATQLNHVLSDWHLSRSDSTGRELVPDTI
jgi:hypothetical protein